MLEKHYGYVAQQIALIDALNPGADYRLLVVDNAAKAGVARLVAEDPRCRVIAGVEPDGLPLEGRGSYHHAAALNLALPQVGSRFLLVLDPDFFVIRPGWIADCLHHMRAGGLMFFGAPWNYVSFRKWRYFPCVHFLMIDLDQADRRRIDFTPAIVEDRRWLNSPAANWLKTHAPLVHARSLLESRRDTGWRLRRDFGARGRRRSDVVQPVIDLDAELIHPKYLRTPRARSVEPRLPRRWSFFPAPGSYVDPSEAPFFQQPAMRALAPESFAWRGAPFAFHMRRNMRDKTKGRTAADMEREQAEVARVLRQVAAGKALDD